MKASRKGTRLNDRHNFKQPLPHLRDRMTAMCVLSKISGLQDKIRATEDHDVIVRGAERKLESPGAKYRGGKLVRACEKIGDDLLKLGEKYRCAERESPDGNELTIKIGLGRTLTEKGFSDKRGNRDVADIIRHLKNDSIISVGQMNSNEYTEELRADKDDGHDRGYGVGIQSTLPAVPPKGIGPVLQHWESMIGKKAALDAKYPSDEMRMMNDNAGEKIEAILRSKSSQFPSKAELLVRETAAAIDTFLNNERTGSNNNNNDRGCDVATRAAKDLEPAASANRGGKLKRMALELLDILVANKRNANDVPSSTIMGSGSVRGGGRTSDASRMKTIYQRIPNHERRMKDRHIRRRTEIHDNCSNISRTESSSRLSESTREGAIHYEGTCTDITAVRSPLKKKPSTGRVTPVESNFDDWLMGELRLRQGIQLQL